VELPRVAGGEADVCRITLLGNSTNRGANLMKVHR
jgi:hypothetical protein